MSRPRHPLVGLIGLAVITACAAAPAPATLTQNGGTTGGLGGAGTTAGTTSGTLPGGTTGVGAGGTGGSLGAGQGGAGSSGGGQLGSGSTGTGGTTGTGSTGTSGTSGGTAGTPLFTPAEDTIGLTPTSLRICGHAALTYAAAFDTSPDDLGVYWTALNEEKGGVHGRKVSLSFYDDAYDPIKAQKAAEDCIATKPFLMEGGIGFDQIPAVRNVAEQRHTLYLYHTATVKGSAGLKYSFTELPSVERVGEGFAQLAGSKFRGKRIGIVKRLSVNWEPGVTAFKAVAKSYGLNVVPGAEREEKASAGNYSNSIALMKDKNVEVVWIWLNALETGEFIAQMKAQNYHPNVMAFPFNLTTQTLAVQSMNPPLDGVAMYPSYSKGDYSGLFSGYASDMQEFERQYAKYRPNAKLEGPAGDLLFLNWVGQKALGQQLLDCGRDCTRNKFVPLLQNYKKVPTPAACLIDFTVGDRHHGSDRLVFMTSYQRDATHWNWRPTKNCVAP